MTHVQSRRAPLPEFPSRVSRRDTRKRNQRNRRSARDTDPHVVNIAADDATVGVQSGVNIALDNATVGEQRGVILGDVHVGGGTPGSVADRIAAARAAAERARARGARAREQAEGAERDGTANVANGDRIVGIQAGRIYGNVYRTGE
jgi:hypothetical protein